MKRKNGATDAGDSTRQRTSGQQKDTLSDGAGKNIGNQRAALNAKASAMSSREQAATGREDAAHLREDAAGQREDAADLREGAVHLREGAVGVSEKFIREADAMEASLNTHIIKLRQANEHLVIASMQAQSMIEELQKTKDQMIHMAHHDAVTGLPNRILLKEKLDQALALAKRHRMKLAVLFLDLDQFKTINDSLGHDIGDQLLQSVAQRLMASVRATDTVSRQGGDEFVALLSEVANEKSVEIIANKIREAVAAPYSLAKQDLHIGVTIGISMYPDDGEDAETLIRNADIAMYHAKSSGRNRHHFFMSEMNDRAVERQTIESDLHLALEHQEFELYYQPQVELQTGGIIGGEALVRWHHPVRGLLLPAVFMPIAEECGAIVPIGRWVLHEACRQAQAWLDIGLPLQVVAVNISAIEFGRSDFLENVRTVLLDTRLEPHHLELELTESVLMKHADSTVKMLEALTSMGVRIAIDDFGTGFSSLSYLKQFPVETLKIDQSFVANIVSDSNDDILVDSVISLGKSLRHRVIAEGIETPEQLGFLSSHHCTAGQGYYLSPPLIAAQFSTFLQTGVSADILPRSASL
jgi:diguanylate cyclase